MYEVRVNVVLRRTS